MTGPRPSLLTQDIVRLYADGLSLEKVALQLGTTRKTVSMRLRKAGVALRTDRVAVDVDEVVRLYVKERLSEQEVAARLGTTRTVIKRRLRERDIKRRTGSEANLIRMGRMTPDARAALALHAQNARRGRPDTEAVLIAKALTRERTLQYVGYGERQMLAWLEARGRSGKLQKAIGPYNVDIAVGTVAVEIHIEPGYPLSMPRHHKRIEYILNAGWHIIYVWGTGHRPLLEASADNLIAFFEECERLPASRRQYRVIWGTGEPAPPPSQYGHEFPDVIALEDPVD